MFYSLKTSNYLLFIGVSCGLNPRASMDDTPKGFTCKLDLNQDWRCRNEKVLEICGVMHFRYTYMKRFNRARLTSPEPGFFLPFKSNKVSDSVFLFSTFLLSQTGLNYNLRFPINIVKLGTLKEKINISKWFYQRENKAWNCFWSFFHTIGLNFKTLAHFFTLQSVLIPATESQTQTLIVEV